MKQTVLVILCFLLFTSCAKMPVNISEPSHKAEDTSLNDTTLEEVVAERLQSVIDSGQFSEEFHQDGQFGEFKAYANTALGFTYRYEENDESYIGISAPKDSEENKLMEAHAFKDSFSMYLVEGDGAIWVNKQTEESLQYFIKSYREDDEYMKEYQGDDYKEYLARGRESRDKHEAWAREQWGEEYEKSYNPFGQEEYDNIAFWPVEYIIADKVFTGLQINVIWSGSGFNSGETYLFCQIEKDIAVVISIFSEESAGAVASRHISRFEAIPDNKS